MLTHVHYRASAGNFAWPIPFAFDRPEAVGVNLVDAVGNERRLACGRDYLIQDGAVVCVVPDGCSLSIYLDEPVDEAAASQRLLRQAVQSRAAQQAAPAALVDADAGQSARLADMERELRTSQAALRDEIDRRMAELARQIEELLAGREADAAALLAARQAQAKDEQLQALAREGQAAVQSVAAKTVEAQASIGQAREEAVDKILSTLSILTSNMEEVETARKDLLQVASLMNNTEREARAAVDEVGKKTEDALAQADVELAGLAADYASRLTASQTNALASIEAAGARAARESEAAARLAGQAWPLQGWQSQANELAAGSLLVLPEPLHYYPGRNSLYIALNGYMLTLGRDFEEVGSAAALSNTIRLRRQTHTGDVWSFWVAPTNAAQAASQYAERAEAAAFDAAAATATAQAASDSAQAASDKAVTETASRLADVRRQCQQAVTNVATLRDNAKDELAAQASKARQDACDLWQSSVKDIRDAASQGGESLRQLWRQAELGVAEVRQDAQAKACAAKIAAGQQAEAAAGMAGQSLRLAQCAWQAAYQASLFAARPGIACAPSVAALSTLPSGMYIINPLITAPTPFMGVWPVRDFSEATWDGIFFIGQPYPDNPDLPDPPPYPEHPEDTPGMRPDDMRKEWLPCGHKHE